MKSELKAKWLEALRSGKYRQKKKALRTDLGFCCLGVLVDVAEGGSDTSKPPLWKKHFTWQVRHKVQRGPARDCDGTILPETYGLTSGDILELTRINDTSDDFTRVIEYIEENISE